MYNSIKGVIVDAGHGGIDSGAVGNGLEEKNLNLESSLYIYERLKDLGIPVKLTRTDDEYLPKNDRIKKVLSLYDNSPNILLVSNHINAGGAEGAEVVYSLKNNPTFAELILRNIAEKGQIPRKVYQRRLPENPNKDYYYILRESGNVEPVLIEYGFIDNVNDSKKLRNNIKDYAEGVVKAIAEYTGINYISPEYNDYIVQKGDTLYKIAQNNDISINDLKELNNLKSNDLYIGEQIIVPKKITENEKYEIYKVKKGDSLWKISKDYNINVNDLIEINNLKDLTININQELLVPKKPLDNNIYIVEKGDTLWSIAKKYELPVEELKEKNNIVNNLLTVGQELIIK